MQIYIYNHKTYWYTWKEPKKYILFTDCKAVEATRTTINRHYVCILYSLNKTQTDYRNHGPAAGRHENTFCILIVCMQMMHLFLFVFFNEMNSTLNNV